MRLNELPIELLIRILSFLTAHEMVNASLTSREMRTAARSSTAEKLLLEFKDGKDYKYHGEAVAPEQRAIFRHLRKGKFRAWTLDRASIFLIDHIREGRKTLRTLIITGIEDPMFASSLLGFAFNFQKLEVLEIRSHVGIQIAIPVPPPALLKVFRTNIVITVELPLQDWLNSLETLEASIIDTSGNFLGYQQERDLPGEQTWKPSLQSLALRIMSKDNALYHRIWPSLLPCKRLQHLVIDAQYADVVIYDFLILKQLPSLRILILAIDVVDAGQLSMCLTELPQLSVLSATKITGDLGYQVFPGQPLGNSQLRHLYISSCSKSRICLSKLLQAPKLESANITMKELEISEFSRDDKNVTARQSDLSIVLNFEQNKSPASQEVAYLNQLGFKAETTDLCHEWRLRKGKSASDNWCSVRPMGDRDLPVLLLQDLTRLQKTVQDRHNALEVLPALNDMNI